jgi:protein required for attachment to host cells
MQNPDIAGTAWVLVADGARARLFESQGPEFREIADFPNPEGRMDNRELNSDADGRVRSRGLIGRSHAASAGESAVDHDTDLFAGELVSRLDKARAEHRYSRLYVVSPPRFLGKLRERMGKELRGLVRGELDKDLSKADEPAIAAQVRELERSRRGETQ